MVPCSSRKKELKGATKVSTLDTSFALAYAVNAVDRQGLTVFQKADFGH